MNFPLIPFAILGLAAGSFALVVDPAPASPFADDVSRYISLTVTGTSLVDPSYLVMETTLTSSAKIGGECVMDFAQARARAVGGLESTGLPGLEVTGSGVEFNYGPPAQDNNMNGFIMSSNGMDEPSEGVSCKESLSLRFVPEGDTETQQSQVAQAIDIAVELGLGLKTNVVNPYYGYPGQNDSSGTHTVAGRLNDEHRLAAYSAAQADAMARAMAEAGNLAALSGRTLGGVISINQTSQTLAWKGLGEGVRASSTMTVRFELN